MSMNNSQEIKFKFSATIRRFIDYIFLDFYAHEIYLLKRLLNLKKKYLSLLCSSHYSQHVTYLILTLHHKLTKSILLTYIPNKMPGDQQFGDYTEL